MVYLDCTRRYLQFDMLVAIVSVMNNETCLFGTRSSDDLGYQRKTSIFSLSAGVTNIHPGYYVYQIAPY